MPPAELKIILGKTRKLSDAWRRGQRCAAHEQDVHSRNPTSGALRTIGKIVCWRERSGEHYVAFDLEGNMHSIAYPNANAAAAALLRPCAAEPAARAAGTP